MTSYAWCAVIRQPQVTNSTQISKEYNFLKIYNMEKTTHISVQYSNKKFGTEVLCSFVDNDISCHGDFNPIKDICIDNSRMYAEEDCNIDIMNQ